MARQPDSQAGNRKTTGALERVVLRNEFYRDKFRVLVTSTPILAGALLVSIGLNVVLANRQPERFFFTVDSVGRVIPVTPLAEAYVSEPFLVNWVSEKVVRAYSMDPQNYRQQVQDMSLDFTTEGFEQYVGSLKESGTIELMTKNLLVSTATAQGAPVVIERGTANGVYFWKVVMPVMVRYRSATKGSEKLRRVIVTVVRRPTLENPLGIGINQFVAGDMAPSGT